MNRHPITQLNEEQQAAIHYDNGPLLIIAGAGTGKTTVITERIKHLILDKKIPPSQILALTFTEKAASEMEERIDVALPYGYTQMWIETFHAFCDRILRLEAIHIGLTPSYKLSTEAETLLFLRKNLYAFNLDYFRPLGNPTKFLQGMLQHFNRLKDDDITPEEYLRYSQEIRKPIRQLRGENRKKVEKAGEDEIKKTLELALAFETYEALKTKEGIMDFSDLISNTLKLFRKRPHILKHYQQLFKYILVDEFQDTNYSQNEMAILLSGHDQNITVVGDDDQSIYRWRGAALANMIQFRSHFPKANIITLTKNYRSTQTILDGAYQLIQHNNPDRLEVKEAINKKLTAMRGEKGEDIALVYATRVEEEAKIVVKLIRDEVSAKGGSSPASPAGRSGRKNYSYNDFAILVRANDHAQPFVRALERAHIPYQFLGPGHLFQQEEIKDLIAYLRVLANFEDNACLYRVVTMPIFGIAARDVASLLNFGKRNNCSLFETMEQVDNTTLIQEGKEKVKKIIEMMKKHLEKVPKEPADQILYYFFEESGLLGYYLDPRSLKTEREAQNVARLFEKLHSFAANREDTSVFAVVDWIDLSMELGESPQATEVDWATNNAVNILTVHSSKGLEFPVVFVVNLVTQRFPSRDRKEQIPVPKDLIKETLPEGDENLQEERRLFYVAVTRARDKLFLTASKFYGEAKRERKLSPFIEETLGEEYVKRIVKKITASETVQQLSLLDMVNATITNTPKEEKKTMPDISQTQPLTYISYSQIQAFLTCPLHYKLRYLLNVPTPASPALSYGLSVHNTLRDFYQLMKERKNVHADDINDILKKNWIHLGYVSKKHEEQAYQQADRMLLSFAKQSLLNPEETIALELPFQFWINKKLKVGGRIDRIDRKPDGRIEIIDYKTGTNVPDQKKVQEDLQLTFYALAATEIQDKILHRSPDEIILTLYYLEANKRISTYRNKEELLIAKDKILSIAEDIEKSDFLCSGSIFCKNCEFKMLCSAYTA